MKFTPDELGAFNPIEENTKSLNESPFPENLDTNNNKKKNDKFSGLEQESNLIFSMLGNELKDTLVSIIRQELGQIYQLFPEQKSHNKKGADFEISRDELRKQLSQKELRGLILIFLLPLVNALISSITDYLTTGVVSFGMVFLILSTIIAPVAVAFLRNAFNVTNRHLETRLEEQQQKLIEVERSFAIKEQQLLAALNLQAQFIKLNVPPEKQPSDLLYEDIRSEELREENLQLRKELFRLRQEFDTMKSRMHELDPSFKTEFIRGPSKTNLRKRFISTSKASRK